MFVVKKLLLVEWVDASRLNAGWIDLSDIPEPYPHKCVTAGFLHSRNEHGIILIPTIGDIAHPDSSHAHDGISIPSCAILSECELTVT